MIHNWELLSPIPHEAILAYMIMSDEQNSTSPASTTMKKAFEPGSKGKVTAALFTPEELDIYVNKVTLEAYIFHGKEIDYSALERLEYDPKDHTVDVVKKDGTRLDLGVKIQWLVRPYFTKTDEINIVQTKDGQSINGVVLPIKHKNP